MKKGEDDIYHIDNYLSNEIILGDDIKDIDRFFLSNNCVKNAFVYLKDVWIKPEQKIDSDIFLKSISSRNIQDIYKKDQHIIEKKSLEIFQNNIHIKTLKDIIDYVTPPNPKDMPSFFIADEYHNFRRAVWNCGGLDDYYKAKKEIRFNAFDFVKVKHICIYCSYSVQKKLSYEMISISNTEKKQTNISFIKKLLDQIEDIP